MTRALTISCTALTCLAIACGDSGGGPGGGEGGDPSAGGAPGSGGDDPGVGAGAEGGAPPHCAGGPLGAPIAGCAPPPFPSTGDPHQDCVDRINQLRLECQCLPPLARWTDGEACTDDQAAGDQGSNSPHGGFGACGEFAQNTCPNWGSEADVVGGCLQSMWDEGPGEDFAAHGHYINMSSTDYSKVACGFSSSNAGVWSNQNFAP